MKKTTVVEVTARLDNWYSFGGSIIGTISGDKKKRFEDGKIIMTSKVVNMSTSASHGKCVKTLNSLYQLGTPAKKKLVGFK
jgi:hypothetical protein